MQIEVIKRRWLTDTQLCLVLGVSPMTLHRWRKDPKLNFPLRSFVNDRGRTDILEVEPWMAARKTAKHKTALQKGQRALIARRAESKAREAVA
jgi:predicted site-specific integrase-resolvase